MPGHPDQPGPPSPRPRLTPADPFTELEDQAAYLHETYTTMMAAGFPEERAFQLVLCLLSHALEDGGHDTN
jgi:hypothetical protein